MTTQDDTASAATHPMVVAVCAFRVENIAKHLRHNLAQLSGDEYFVLLDRPVSPEAELVAEQVRAAGATMHILGATNGLSASRNTVLAHWPAHHVLFVDDDVRLDAAAVDAVRAALRKGAHMAGTRLSPPAGRPKPPWYFTTGQHHLVGWHRADGPIKIWGACMGVDSSFAHANGLRFAAALSRTGRNLMSGEDTTFIAQMRQAGGQESLLADYSVVHDIDLTRLRLRYLLRRAYWQGRSEASRDQAVAGLRKELDRHRTAPESAVAWALTLLYGTATAVGIGHEMLLRALYPARAKDVTAG